MHKTLFIEKDVEITMRDSTILRADIYHPANSGTYPILLHRTPYGKCFSSTNFALIAAERGYVVVIQDTRGRWSSDGDGSPFVYEKYDGYDTVEWLAKHPWSNGKVGMFGGSYCGYTQLATAVMKPKSLITIIPAVSFSDPRKIFFNNGAISLGASVTWSLLSGVFMAIMRFPGTPEDKDHLIQQLVYTVNGMTEGHTFNQLPLYQLPLIGHQGIIHWLADAIDKLCVEDYWQAFSCSSKDIYIPAFHIGGWYDILISSTIRDFHDLFSANKAYQKLLIGPWTHGSFASYSGEVDFGLQASDMLLMPDEMYLKWFDYWLKGIQNGLLEEPPIQIFVMGINEWRYATKWPLEQTKYTSFYLHSRGAANSLNGNGTLDHLIPTNEPYDRFLYDPLNPVPSHGGGLCCWQAALPAGAFDQRKIEERPDVLVFSTSPLEQDVEVTGNIILHLWASSSARDTDFTAKLVDVSPEGYARNIQDSIVRARFREDGKVSLLIPDQIYHFIINLGPTSNMFKKGQRIRLEISSSNFPKYDRNTNTGDTIGKDAVINTAIQTIFHDAEHPSHLILPVIPNGY